MNAAAQARGAGAGRLAASRFLDPALLTRIGNLDLVARTVVDGFISGLHRTRHLGVSTDFAEHRAYAPGDDVRRIDWQVYGRTDRLYIRSYEAETNANVMALGGIAHRAIVKAVGVRQADYKFAHGAVHELPGFRVLDSYHCSRYNTNTGRLTDPMFDAIFAEARALLDK